MDYRSIPRIANSDLSELKADIFGEVRKTPVKAFAFGSALHELILEPNTILDIPAGIDLALVQKLARQVRADRFCSWVLRFSKKENVQLWRDPATGLDLKSKLDIIFKGQLIVDIKTTSQRDYAGFLRSCDQYDYDRQAAFYLDSVAAKRFVFVAVQKVKPFDIWTIKHHTDSQFIQSGRKKYRALLREWKRRADAGQSFVPSRWNLTPNPEPELCCC